MKKNKQQINKLSYLIILLLILVPVISFGQKVIFLTEELSDNELVEYLEVQGVKYYLDEKKSFPTINVSLDSVVSFIIKIKRGYLKGVMSYMKSYCSDNSLRINFKKNKKNNYSYYQENCSSSGIVGTIIINKQLCTK